jgi:hypothetical protein
MAVETEGGVMKRKSSLRRIRHLGLALAIAAFAVPAAQAMPEVQYADDLHVTVPHVPNIDLKYADDLIRPVASESQSTQVTDGLGRPLPPEVIPTSEVVSASDSSGFDWRYAGIGAGFGFALILLSVGALLVERHNRRSRLAAI